MCEDRLLLTAFVVNDNADTDTGTATSGTLRHVINQLDATGAATNTITFNIGNGLQTITLGSNLQAITKPVSIDGYSQPGGAKANDAAIGTNAIILIQVSLNGHLGLVFSPGAEANGGSSVKGLSIFGGSGAAIGVNTSNVSVTGNFLGVQADGTTIAANAIGASVVAAATAGVQIGTPVTGRPEPDFGQHRLGREYRRDRAGPGELDRDGQNRTVG